MTVVDVQGLLIKRWARAMEQAGLEAQIRKAERYLQEPGGLPKEMEPEALAWEVLNHATDSLPDPEDPEAGWEEVELEADPDLDLEVGEILGAVVG